MAKNSNATEKEPGRIKQMIQVYRTTKEHDTTLPWMLLLVFLAPVLVAVIVLALLSAPWFSWLLWVLFSLMLGLLLTMIVLGRRAEKVAYQQIEGRQGAAGAVLSSGLRGAYIGEEAPVAVNRQGDAVFRVVGRTGVTLVSEGDARRISRSVHDERAKIRRVLPGQEVRHLHVGHGEGEVPLTKLTKAVKQGPKVFSRAEVRAVAQRLSSIRQQPLGIPKGIDPMRVRKPSKPR